MKNAISSWNPLLELEEFQKRILGAFNAPTATSRDGNDGRQRSLAMTEWAPLVDITDDDENYVVSAELPQVKKEDVKVTAENGMLTISGERKFVEEEGDKKKYHRVERAMAVLRAVSPCLTTATPQRSRWERSRCHPSAR